MAKFSELPDGGASIAVGDQLASNQDGTSRRFTVAELIAFIVATLGALDTASIAGAASLDLSVTSRRFRRTLTGTVTGISISEAPSGPGNWIFDFVQDGTGGWTLPASPGDWPAGSLFIDGVPPVLDTTSDAHNLVALYYDGTNYFWSAACGPYI